jgi:hypothetical protein
MAPVITNLSIKQKWIFMELIDHFHQLPRLATMFLLSSLVVVSAETLHAQAFQPRLDQGATLEPQGKVINGAGQDQSSYTNYWNVMHSQGKPLVYMAYQELYSATSDWADGLKAALMQNAGRFQIPQIGLSMSVGGGSDPSAHYEQDVAAGLYDQQISAFIDGLQTLAFPAYVRIGYEFNGAPWNGYQPESYKQAYTRITNMIRARGVEVATVWDCSLDAGSANMNFWDYYPGDEYVDWWGINLFSTSHFTDPNGISFLDSAAAHHKPVMIGESTPRYIGVLNGQQSWNNWFAPFFAYIHTYPEIKAFCYINWQWSQSSQWSTWGDARLEMNSIVGSAFAGEMDSTEYLNATTETAFRRALGIQDTIPPATPGPISVVQPGFPLQLAWDTVGDPSGLSHYIVYRHGVLSDYALTLPYLDKTVAAGDTITYAVSAMDRAGNEGQKTAGYRVTLPSTLQKALNGQFDNGTSNWQLSLYATGASATLNIDSSYALSGKNSAKITITQVTGTDWHLQLWQWLSIHPKHKYRITYLAKSSASKQMTLAVQQAASPYTMYFAGSHTLSTSPQKFVDSLTMNTSVSAKLEFSLGTAGTGQVWIDSVSITEISTSTMGVEEAKEQCPTSFALHQNYPNPFNPTTTIRYSLPHKSQVLLTVYNTLGQQVATIVQAQQDAGSYEVKFDGSALASGVYIYRIQAGSFVQAKKLLLVR